ncbi:hypothetical protein BV22DRAFT_754483 [Leucogyrophana mollusca]|uniref:Uncharacterized protein n=1 Tax=Leucogyrophana mollusca TaxID=85980 RepID=A0ACB8B6M8_9AGAM|nr:hypothetical protein BV22DRAFT_754483 [Leucogyrophana mollusca]
MEVINTGNHSDTTTETSEWETIPLSIYVGPRPPFPSPDALPRTLPVYDPLKEKVVHLGDTWRINRRDIAREGGVDIYHDHRLHRCQIPHCTI